MSALQPTVKKKRVWLRIALLVVAIAAICDWMRPPDRQVTVVIYKKVVLKGYYALLQPWGKYFVRCRFNPTCSVYSRYAMETHGFPKGLWLTTSRLFRCMPWVPYGTRDPVPGMKE
ncbi:MAG TPA: membrane protein insertion efficiency factor YidD [Chthoniobacterales bacterium]|jgi:putative membrane protein insertion efficiency factor|nr:membrane protein insertion efficiency factor YidD [Chthoniobacterales bacterium]